MYDQDRSALTVAAPSQTARRSPGTSTRPVIRHWTPTIADRFDGSRNVQSTDYTPHLLDEYEASEVRCRLLARRRRPLETTPQFQVAGETPLLSALRVKTGATSVARIGRRACDAVDL